MLLRFVSHCGFVQPAGRRQKDENVAVYHSVSQCMMWLRVATVATLPAWKACKVQGLRKICVFRFFAAWSGTWAIEGLSWRWLRHVKSSSWKASLANRAGEDALHTAAPFGRDIFPEILEFWEIVELNIEFWPNRSRVKQEIQSINGSYFTTSQDSPKPSHPSHPSHPHHGDIFAAGLWSGGCTCRFLPETVENSARVGSRDSRCRCGVFWKGTWIGATVAANPWNLKSLGAEWLNGSYGLRASRLSPLKWCSCDIHVTWTWMTCDDIGWLCKFNILDCVEMNIQFVQCSHEFSSIFSKCALVDILWQDFLSVRSWRTGASTMESAGSGPLRSSARIQRGRGFWRINKCGAVWEDNWCYLMLPDGTCYISVSSL